MKGIVFGKGYLGTRIAETFGYLLPEMDVLDIQKLRDYLEKEKPEVVINTVGKTGRPNIDWCETHKEETILSNVAAAVILASVCSEKGIYFVHFGSGCVYYGDNGGNGYTEEDEPNHSDNLYTRTKIYSEKILKDFSNCLQIRPRMPVDDRPGERNFIDKVKKYSKLIDEQNSMTCVPDLLVVLGKLIDRKAVGVYNVTNPGTISAAEIMTMYQDIVDSNHAFEKITAEQLDQMTLAKRSNCMLNTDKLRNEGIEMPEIHDAVEQCLLRYRESLGK